MRKDTRAKTATTVFIPRQHAFIKNYAYGCASSHTNRSHRTPSHRSARGRQNPSPRSVVHAMLGVFPERASFIPLRRARERSDARTRARNASEDGARARAEPARASSSAYASFARLAYDFMTQNDERFTSMRKFSFEAFDEGEGEGEGEHGRSDATVSVLATARSKKRPCVALAPRMRRKQERANRNDLNDRAFALGVREAAEEAFERDRAFEEDYATYGVEVLPFGAAREEGDFEIVLEGSEEDDDEGESTRGEEEEEEEDEDVEEEEDGGVGEGERDSGGASVSTRTTVCVRLRKLSGSAKLESLLISGAKCGLTIELVMEHLMKNAMYREGVPNVKKMAPAPPAPTENAPNKMKVYVVFGGSSAQRQLSCESGRHVFLTLKRVPTIEVIPVVINGGGGLMSNLADVPAWRLPYAHVLDPEQWDDPRAPDVGRFAPSKRVRADLDKYGWVKPSAVATSADVVAAPRVSRLGALLAIAAREGAIIFNALHGGFGEDGSLQQLCASSGVAYTGSSPLASRLCHDKAATGKALGQRPIPGVACLNKRLVPTSVLVSKALDEQGWGGRERTEGAKRLWMDIVSSLNLTSTNAGVCVKPVADGSSLGVRRLMDENDMLAYAEEIAAGDVPSSGRGYVFEPFFDARAPWTEIVVTLMGTLGNLRVIGEPTIRSGVFGENHDDGVVLSRDEDVMTKVKERVQSVGHVLGVEGCVSVDAFANANTGDLIVIEVNSVPEMHSPTSTVFAHAKGENPPIDPETFCTRALSLALVRRFRQ